MKAKMLVLAVFFATGLTLTLVVARRRAETPLRSPPTEDDVRNIPGLSEGEVAAWPLVENLRGEPVRLERNAKRYVFVVVFSSQCQGCERDADFWKLAAREAEKKNVAMYLLSIDSDINDVRKFVDSFGLTNIPVVYDRHGEANSNLKINIVPQYVLLTGEGRVLDRWVGLSHFNFKHEKVKDAAVMFRLVS